MSRARLIALMLVGLAAVVMASWLSTWSAATAGQVASADYASTYVAATQWREGHADLLYDVHAQIAAGTPLGLSGAQFAGNRFVDPPLAAVVAAPFSLLSLDASFRAWSLLQLLLMLVAVVVAARAAPWPAGLPRAVPVAAATVALAGAGTAMLVLQGQWDGFSALGLAAAYASWRRGRLATGGAVLTATSLLAKPHLALVLAAWMLGRRDRRMLGGAAAGAAAVAAVTLALTGPAAMVAFISAPVLSSGVTPVRMLLSFTGLFASWLGDSGVAYALAIIAGVSAMAVGLWLGARARGARSTLEATLGAATVLSLLASPHVLTQDLALLGVPLVWCLARAATVDGPARWPGTRTLALLGGWVALDLAARVDAGNYSPAPPGRLVPVLLIAILLAALVAGGSLRPSRALRLRLGSVPPL